MGLEKQNSNDLPSVQKTLKLYMQIVWVDDNECMTQSNLAYVKPAGLHDEQHYVYPVIPVKTLHVLFSETEPLLIFMMKKVCLNF